MSVAIETPDAPALSADGIELPWDLPEVEPDHADLIVPERPDVDVQLKPYSIMPHHAKSLSTDDADAAPDMERPVAVPNDMDEAPAPLEWPVVARSRSGWTVALLCIGLAIISCCVIIPQADANRRLAYEQLKLQLDLEQIKNQASVNREFLKRISTDATLAERLAQRQMKMIPRGTTVLELRDQPGQNDMSPFLLVNLPAPSPLPEYKPVGGIVADVCTDSRTRLYLLGAGLFLIAAGLVMGGTPVRRAQSDIRVYV